MHFGFFSKKSYSDREIEEILQSLFAEKKKVAELELKVKNGCLGSSPSSTEVDNLRAEIHTLRLKLTQQPVENTPENNPEQGQRVEQLERAIQFMRKRVEEAHLENQELLKKLEAVPENVFSFQAELKKVSDTLQQERQQHEELKAEEKALQQQLETLRVHVLKAQKESKQSKEQQELLFNAQKEIELLKSMMMRTVQEFKEERLKEEQLFKSQMEALKTELEQAKAESQTIATWRNEQKRLETELQEALKQNDAITLAQRELGLFTEVLKQKLLLTEDNKKLAQEALSQKETLNDQLQGQVATLTRSNTEMEELMRQTKEESQEHASRLRIAQQHLAKKVREATLLAEKSQELNARIAELEQSLDTTKAKFLEAQISLDLDGNQTKKLQEQYQNSLKTLEAQAARWEEKYFHMHEKWQEGEARIREHKRLEERYQKLQQALSQLGSLLGAPLMLPAIETTILPAEPTVDVVKEQVLPLNQPIQPSLFETAAPSRYKESLFG